MASPEYVPKRQGAGWNRYPVDPGVGQLYAPTPFTVVVGAGA